MTNVVKTIFFPSRFKPISQSNAVVVRYSFSIQFYLSIYCTLIKEDKLLLILSLLTLGFNCLCFIFATGVAFFGEGSLGSQPSLH